MVLGQLSKLALVVYLAWMAWDQLGPQRPDIGPVRRDFADKIIPTIVSDLRESRGDIRQAALLHFVNDPTDYFTDHLRLVIEQSGILDLRDRTVGEKIRSAIRLRQPSYGDSQSAIQRGRQLGVPGVIYGTIHSFESRGSSASMDVEVNLVDVSTGVSFFSKRYSKDSTRLALLSAVVEQKAGDFPWFQRLLGWVLAVLLLPVFTISFIRAMVHKESNRINAFVLGIYTLADMVLAWLLVGAALRSFWAVAFFIAAVAVAFVYNIRLMTFALRLEK